MDSEGKKLLGMLGGVVLIALVLVFVIMGPAGIKTSFKGWQASAYGSDWIVVQYAQSGCVITHWKLEDEAIHNESDSDGIYFVTEEGPVVHLSGHYVYVQNPTAEIEETLLVQGQCGG